MDLFAKTKELCKVYDIKPARSRGQNFLITENIYDRIVEAAEIKKDDVVLEVGPGLGFLTSKLARKVKKVIAVELDDKLAKVLKNNLGSQGLKNVEILNQDILDFSLAKSKFSINKIVANLPYNITSVFLRKFLSAEIKPEAMVLMLQKEVAERIVSKQGKMSLLAVSVQFYAQAKIIEQVAKNNFWPEPEVDSAIIKLKGISKNLENDEKGFFRLVKIGFSARRKMLKNNLAAGFQISPEKAEKKLANCGFASSIRAQELSVEDWIKLFGEF